MEESWKYEKSWDGYRDWYASEPWSGTSWGSSKENEQHGKDVDMDKDWCGTHKTSHGNEAKEKGYRGKDYKSKAKGGSKGSSASWPVVSTGTRLMKKTNPKHLASVADLKAERLLKQRGGWTAHAKAKWGSREEKDWWPEDGPAKHSKYVAPPAFDADTEEVTEEEFTKSMGTASCMIQGTSLPKLIPRPRNMQRVKHAVPLSKGGAIATMQEYYCDFCKRFSGVASSFVFCVEATGQVLPFSISKKVGELKETIYNLTGHADAGLDEEDTRKFHNMGLSQTCVSCCYECYGEKFAEPASQRSKHFYINYGDGKNPKKRLTSAWGNIRKKRQGLGAHPKREDEICEYLMNKALKTMDEEMKITAKELFAIILEQPEFVALADWNPKLSDEIYLLYRCARCKMAPLKLCNWVRSVKKDVALKEDSTMASTGDWRCAARYDKATVGKWDGGPCLQKWGDGHGHGRVLVIKRQDEGAFKNGSKYAMYFLGPDRSKEDEFVMTMLRAAVLLDKIPESKRVLVDGKFPAEDVVSAIEELNEACEKSLSVLAECRGLRSCNYDEFKEKCPHRESYLMRRESCAPLWFFAAAGVLFKALYVPEETEVIDSGFKNDLLACLIAYHDFAGLQKPKNAGPKRNAYWYVQAAGPYYLQHRKAIPWDHPSVTGTALELLCTKSSLPTAVAHSIRQVPTALFGSGGLTEL